MSEYTTLLYRLEMVTFGTALAQEYERGFDRPGISHRIVRELWELPLSVFTGNVQVGHFDRVIKLVQYRYGLIDRPTFLKNVTPYTYQYDHVTGKVEE